jgi:glycosyltransferase involved in cell wall biosynthesis
MRILIATTSHGPTDVRVGERIVGSLLAAGYEVEWIGPSEPAELPFHSDINFTRLPPTKSRLSRLLSRRKLIRKVQELASPPDWIYCCDPEAFNGLRRYCVNSGSLLWFDIHEQYEAGNADRWLGPLRGKQTYQLVRRWISAKVRLSDLVTVASPEISKGYECSETALTLLNAASFNLVEPRSNAIDFSARKTVMVGKIGFHRNLELIADALDVWEHQGAQLDLLVIGKETELASVLGQDRTIDLTSIKRASRYVLYDSMPHSDVIKILQECWLAIVGYSGNLASASLPNRLFESMAAGVPIICPQQSPYMVRIITDAQCGSTYDNSDSLSLVSAVNLSITDPALRNSWSVNARESFLHQFTWESQITPVLKKLTSLRSHTQ